MTKKQRCSETKTYILTKAVGMAYGDNGPLFMKLLGPVGGTYADNGLCFRTKTDDSSRQRNKGVVRQRPILTKAVGVA